MLKPNQNQAARTLSPSPKQFSDLHLFTMPEGGTDSLHFITWDTIEVFGMGEETIEFHGHYKIERATPTSADWAEASVKITMRELSVKGESKLFGRVHATTNSPLGKQSGGQVHAGTVYSTPDSPKLCQMNGFMNFELTDVGMNVFNKEPILLEHTITHIPPIGQGGGTRPGTEVLLYRADDPDGEPVAVLRRVKTHIGAWLDA